MVPRVQTEDESRESVSIDGHQYAERSGKRRRETDFQEEAPSSKSSVSSAFPSDQIAADVTRAVRRTKSSAASSTDIPTKQEPLPLDEITADFPRPLTEESLKITTDARAGPASSDRTEDEKPIFW